LRIVKLVLLAGSLFVSIALAQQENITLLENLYRENRLDELEAKLKQLDNNDQQDPSVLYFKGLFEKDAQKALIYYNQVRTEFKQHPFAAEALLRIAQYYYSLGDYSDARIYLSSILSNYSDTPVKDRTQYLLCQSIYAQGKQDSARIFLQAFIENVRNSPYVDLAVADLETPQLWQNPVKEQHTLRGGEAGEKQLYSVQIGAFSVLKNAKTVRDKFIKLYQHVQVIEKKVDGKVYYAIWIGNYDDLKAARKFAQTFSNQYGIDAKIVKR